MDANRWYDRAWIVLWGVVSSAWCLTAASHLGATFDEPHYLKYGIHAWRSGSYFGLLRAGTMPLPVDVELLPVYVSEQLRGSPYNLDNDFGEVLQIARAGNLVFWWLLLYFCWRLGRRFGGDWGGRLSVALVACEPNLLAHASLATTDISIAACLAMFTEVYLAGRDRAWRRRVGLPGICFGLAVLAKASALPFAALIMAVFEVPRLRRRPIVWPSGGILSRIRAIWRETHAFRWDSWLLFCVGMLTVFVYCGSDWRPESSFVVWAKSLPGGLAHDVMLFIAENLRIFPNAGQGIAYQIQHNFRGHGAYIMGEWHARAIWYYFPMALTMKLTIPVIILLGLTVIVRPRSYANSLGLLAGTFLLFTLNCRVQIGIRLILPVLTFLMVALAVALVNSWPERLPVWTRPASAGLMCLAMLVPMLFIWPNGLCYFNQLWGGPESGYRYLCDSNYDWGQGLDDLREWKEKHNDADLKIWYYGADPRFVRSPANAPLHGMNIQTEEDLRRQVGGCYLAVGLTLMYSNPSFTPSAERTIALLKAKKPVGRTMTFFIYDFTESKNIALAP
jgi:Dolichyl-phosphate-mannose-protein mannosyltransferase